MLKDTPEIKAERVTETLTVYQQKGVFSFGTDAMLLADYVSEQTAAASAKKLCDLCSGTGILSLVLCDRFPNLTADAVEINPDAAEILMKYGMHCLGCAIAHGETVGEAAAVHGADLEKMLEELNAVKD